jgi:hypothetical protein
MHNNNPGLLAKSQFDISQGLMLYHNCCLLTVVLVVEVTCQAELSVLMRVATVLGWWL